MSDLGKIVTLRYKNREIVYTLCRKKVKNLNLRVRAGEVFVSAPKTVSESRINDFVLRHGEFIRRAIGRTAEPKKVVTIRAEEGEKHRLLGKDVILKVMKGRTNKVTLAGDTLILTVTNVFDDCLRLDTLSRYYHDVCVKTVGAALDKYYPVVSDGSFEKPAFDVADVTSYLGKCWRKEGRLRFARLLAQYSPRAVEAVVVHELCHFYAHGHGKDFYRHVLRYMPDYRERHKEFNKTKGYRI